MVTILLIRDMDIRTFVRISFPVSIDINKYCYGREREEVYEDTGRETRKGERLKTD